MGTERGGARAGAREQIALRILDTLHCHRPVEGEKHAVASAAQRRTSSSISSSACRRSPAAPYLSTWPPPKGSVESPIPFVEHPHHGADLVEHPYDGADVVTTAPVMRDYLLPHQMLGTLEGVLSVTTGLNVLDSCMSEPSRTLHRMLTFPRTNCSLLRMTFSTAAAISSTSFLSREKHPVVDPDRPVGDRVGGGEGARGQALGRMNSRSERPDSAARSAPLPRQGPRGYASRGHALAVHLEDEEVEAVPVHPAWTPCGRCPRSGTAAPSGTCRWRRGLCTAPPAARAGSRPVRPGELPMRQLVAAT